MTGVELDLIVTDSLKALALYGKIFDIQTVEQTAYSKGMNEAVFTLYGTRFHLLDENPAYQMIAPKPQDPKTVWMNIIVEDIRSTYDKALNAGCEEMQSLQEIEEYGVINAMFLDPFGYVWMLHQIVKDVSFEERCRIMEQQHGISNA